MVTTPPGEFSEKYFTAENGHVGMTLEKFVNSHAKRLQMNGGGNMTEKQVKDSLIEQLTLQNKTSEFYMDLVNDYMDYWALKRDMIEDIRKNGLRLSLTNGNGFEVIKPNESVNNLPKITATMLKILNDLNLKEPLSITTAEDDYL